VTVKICIRKVDDFPLLKVSGISASFSTCYMSFVGQDDLKLDYSNTADQLRGSFTPFDMIRLGQMKSFFGYLSLKEPFARAIRCHIFRGSQPSS
jgi:hypothetical protein